MDEYYNKNYKTMSLLVKSLIVVNTVLWGFFGIIIFLVMINVNILISIIFTLVMSFSGIFIPIAIITKALRKHIIKQVRISKNGLLLKYLKKEYFIPFNKIDVLYFSGDKFLIISKTSFRHTKAFKKGVICSGWFDKLINKKIEEVIKERKINIKEINQKEFNEFLFQ